MDAQSLLPSILPTYMPTNGLATVYLNPHSNPSGCYWVANAPGLSLLPTGGLSYTVF